MAIIYHQVSIGVHRDRLYEALTTREGLSKWWTAECVAKPEVGFVNEFHDGPQFNHRMKVIHLQSGHSVEWKCVDQHDDWTGTQVSFRLTDRGDQTCLDFKHTGFAVENESYAASNYRWAVYLTNLKRYCELTQMPGGEISKGSIRPVEALH
jgi:uncharacterized protein YndB with AHSA1/START domain